MSLKVKIRSFNIMIGAIMMIKCYYVIESKQEIEKENKILFLLIQELSVPKPYL